MLFSLRGIKGLYFLRLFTSFEELNIYNNIEVFEGCSVGSIICLLSKCGYKAEELN